MKHLGTGLGIIILLPVGIMQDLVKSFIKTVEGHLCIFGGILYWSRQRSLYFMFTVNKFLEFWIWLYSYYVHSFNSYLKLFLMSRKLVMNYCWYNCYNCLMHEKYLNYQVKNMFILFHCNSLISDKCFMSLMLFFVCFYVLIKKHVMRCRQIWANLVYIMELTLYWYRSCQV